MKALVRRSVAIVLEWQVRRLIRRHKPKVIAVAGSVGKTGTKLAIAKVLSQKYRILVHEGNYNSELSLPLSIFELEVPRPLWNPLAWLLRYVRAEIRVWRKYPYEALVLELGTDHPGELPLYLRYLTPDVGVATGVTPEHMANFPGGLDQVAKEELALVKASKILLANREQISPEYRRKYIESYPRHHYYGLSDEEYALKLKSTSPVGGTVGALSKLGQVKILDLRLDVYGAHSAKTAVAAYAVGDLLGLSSGQLEAGLAEIKAPAGRMSLLDGLNGSTIIDDTYNSSPDAAIAALDALTATPVKGRRIAILGSMNELGDGSPAYHETVGRAAAGLDLLVTVGELANRHLGPAAVRAGLDPTRCKPAGDPYAAAQFVKAMLAAGDVLLAKGSQNGIFVEEAVKLLVADPKDRKHLVRQSTHWQKVKRSQFREAYLP